MIKEIDPESLLREFWPITSNQNDILSGKTIQAEQILLGYNGDVKITDFGLVKSKSQISRTVPGLIKGKFSYLSPEAAYGESIDHRSDIYAVGIILWEMLTSHPLFNDPVEMKILDLENLNNTLYIHIHYFQKETLLAEF